MFTTKEVANDTLHFLFMTNINNAVVYNILHTHLPLLQQPRWYYKLFVFIRIVW